jgi:CHAT domain-containing protein
VNQLVAALGKGELRGRVGTLGKPAASTPRRDDKDSPPYAAPYYWAAFVLISDP